MARRTTLILLSILGTILLGTTLLLSSISIFLHIDPVAYLSEVDIPWPDLPVANVSHDPLPGEKIPRILHQTWKEEVLPEKWRGVSQGCKDLMPDYEYMLWTDESSRAFINDNYPWFIETFDGYRYPIQRADAIRYFVLYHFGGTYLDLDVGCLRRLDPLLAYSVILPITKPVGVSNDLMLTAPKHPFMREAIDRLQSFDHDWIMNYPTVMFSTGPMFISAIYGLYSSVAGYPRTPEDEVRILPKALYGKNAQAGEAPHAFFAHYYGSSWHADDAGLVLFLGSYGSLIMYLALSVLVGGAVWLLFLKRRASHHQSAHQHHHSHTSASGLRWRRFGRYDVLLPRIYTDAAGRHRLELGGASFSIPSSPLGSSMSSASATTGTGSPYMSLATSPEYSPSASQPILPISVEVEGSGTTPYPLSAPSYTGEHSAAAVAALRWAAALPSRVLSSLTSPTSPFPSPVTPSTLSHSKPPRTRRSRSRRPGILFFLPAILHSHRSRTRTRPDAAEAGEAYADADIDEEAEDMPLTGRSDEPLLGSGARSPSPPPYAYASTHGAGAGLEEDETRSSKR